MLSKKHRLPLRTELIRVKKEGRLFQGRFFSLLVNSPPIASDSQPTRFGFIVSAKIHKKAVKRNRARRLLIEAIRALLPKVKPGFEVVFLAKKKIIEIELKEIKMEVEKLFISAGLVV